MNDSELNYERDFLVKESVALSYLFGCLFLGIFIIGVLVTDVGWKSYWDGVDLFLIPAGYFFYRARRKEVRIKINKKGFYSGNTLIMDWDHFVQAELTQDNKLGSIKDNFIILLHYREPGDNSIYERKIPMSNTQDKADEEIIEAIDFFYKKSLEQKTVYTPASGIPPIS